MRTRLAVLNDTPTDGPKATLVIRLMTGSVFFWEGILKFVYPNQGVGRFTKIGFPMPVELATFVALLEIIGGLCLLFGYRTRIVSALFIGQMIVAILSTKIALYLGTSPLPLPPAPPTVGMWAVLHESRADVAQLLTCVFLFLAGPGPISLDARRVSRPAGEVSTS
ncbi:MAG: DoxX family protein [Bacteroidetes bacterium]|nr:DoxX family protein [Bacteroidota bacterium]